MVIDAAARLADDMPEGALDRLVSGSWVYGNFATWIGDLQKNRGWELLAEAAQAVFTIKYLPEGETDKRNASIRTIIGAEDAYECLHILREARLVVLDFCEYETTIPAALSSLTQGTE